MAQIVTTLAIILAAMVLFAWNRFPAALVAAGAALALSVPVIVTMPETVGGFGDPVVVLIAALLAIALGLEATGVSAWAGQLLIRQTGTNDTWRTVAIMLVAALFSGLVGMNGAVAAMLPVIVAVAVRTAIVPSRLMVPLAFACLTGAKLTLLGTPVNVIAATQAQEAGVGTIGFLEWSVLGIPQLLGTIVIAVLLGRRLLPERRSASIPADLSTIAQTLVEQYHLEDGLQRLRVRSTSPLIGKSHGDIDLSGYGDLSLVGVVEEGDRPVTRPIAEGDLVLVRGSADAAGRLA